MFEVVTAMNKKIYDETGKDMIKSFLTRWPVDIKLYVYYETYTIDDYLNIRNLYQNEDRIVIINQMEDFHLMDFVMKHKDRKDQSNPLELHKGAVRFSFKTFAIIRQALKETKSEKMIWLDADTYTFNTIPFEFLESLQDKEFLSFLGREDNYSECGFVVYNKKHKLALKFFTNWLTLYISDQVFELAQWHDSFVFDFLKRRIVPYDDQRNLTPWGRGYEHVFINSEIGKYIDHMKGARKNEGSSREADLLEVASEEAKNRYSS